MDEVAPQRNAISRLWNDKEARQVIIQILAFVAIFAFFFIMVRNAIINLEAIGKDISTDFLSQPSNYDISQSLIEYSSRSTNFRAMTVGIINTPAGGGFRHCVGDLYWFLVGGMPTIQKLDRQQIGIRVY